MMAMRMLLLAAWLVGTSLMPVHAQTDATPAREYRVLLVGNSLTYTNNLPALLRAVGASQGTPIATDYRGHTALKGASPASRVPNLRGDNT